MKNYDREIKEFYRKNTIKYQENPFNTYYIEIALIFVGVFLGAYLFLMACANVWDGLKLCL